MTRKEAIGLLSGLMFKGKLKEALDMAIKELEQESTTKNDLGVDCIDRAELLKAMDTWDKFGYTETGCFVREPKCDYVPYVHYEDMINCVKSMPSVTPQLSSGLEKNSKKLEKNFGELDCISREQAIKQCGFGMTSLLIADCLRKLPSVTPQEPSRDMEEIEEVINCDADAETKCKMISNILTAKPHYFEESQESEGV